MYIYMKANACTFINSAIIITIIKYLYIYVHMYMCIYEEEFMYMNE